jgi:hypothetical protein
VTDGGRGGETFDTKVEGIGGSKMRDEERVEEGMREMNREVGMDWEEGRSERERWDWKWKKKKKKKKNN